MKSHIRNDDFDHQELVKILNPMIEQLKLSEQVVATSANFMGFTVQDMLDNAQIKANKF